MVIPKVVRILDVQNSRKKIGCQSEICFEVSFGYELILI
ncbi:Uncharacterized protein dnl_09150 [Desulfonema limicola]|uniref:Uncharacterized protein n=1 Tax=Desulfonema limicola TaxID=45656 RepID=A0A975B4K0_9BACT|nr:Uncharacterized protein dnl_09150 [Desulfonema limicola]